MSFSRSSLSVASLGNSMKPIFVKGFPPSPSFTVLRTLTGSLAVYDSSVEDNGMNRDYCMENARVRFYTRVKSCQKCIMPQTPEIHDGYC